MSVLGRIPLAEIGARLGVDQKVLEVAQFLFFDVGAARHATGWMHCQVFRPEVEAGRMQRAAKMKLAVHGGPALIRALLDAEENLPLDEAQRLVDQELLLHGKLQAALEFDLDTKSAAKFLQCFLRYDLARQKLQLQREKFQWACELAREKRRAKEVSPPGVAPGIAPADAPSEPPAAGAGGDEPDPGSDGSDAAGPAQPAARVA